MPTPTLSKEQLVDRLAQAFRRYGYEGASMVRIAAETGLGKASLYHHFPEGKAQMALAVIEATRAWFEKNIFGLLEDKHPPHQRLTTMLEALSGYYDGGTLAGMPLLVAMCEDRERFVQPVSAFYQRWIATMTQTLTDAGLARDIALRRAQDGVERIEGALAMSRALNDGAVFARMVKELPDQLLAGADRSMVWTVRNRYPMSLSAPPVARRFV